MGVSLLESSGALVSSGEDTDRDSPCLLLASEAARSEHGFSASERLRRRRREGEGGSECKRTRSENEDEASLAWHPVHTSCARRRSEALRRPARLESGPPDARRLVSSSQRATVKPYAAFTRGSKAISDFVSNIDGSR